MLTIKCASCKKKLWKYQKYGHGEVIRCHKDRIVKMYQSTEDGDKVKCQCGKIIGIDKGTYIKMLRKSFTFSGIKINS